MSWVLAALLLAATYLLAMASLHPLDVGAALVIAVGVLALLRRLLTTGASIGGGELLGRLVRFPRFALAVLWEITIGTWRVALVVARLRPLTTPGIVAVPVGERSPTGVAATALAVTLSPGEVFVDLDDSRGVMLVHVLDASDPDAVRRHYEDFYARFQKGVFP